MRLTNFLSGIGKPIVYYPAIAKLLGVKETIFFCHIFFWTGTKEDGWIYRTADELEKETGLTHREQHLVKHNLTSAGIIETRQGRNKIFIRICIDRTNDVWDAQEPLSYPPTPEVLKSREKRRNVSPQLDSRNDETGGQDLRNVIPTSNYSTEREQRDRETAQFSLSVDQSGDTGKKRQRKAVFVKPSVDEMIEYGSEIGLPEIEAKKAHNYYETRGWTVGKSNSPMVDWKGALRNWKIFWKERGGQKQKQAA